MGADVEITSYADHVAHFDGAPASVVDNQSKSCTGTHQITSQWKVHTSCAGLELTDLRDAGGDPSLGRVEGATKRYTVAIGSWIERID